MDLKRLRDFAVRARRELIAAVAARVTLVLQESSVEWTESPDVLKKLKKDIEEFGHSHVVDQVAYTWFNRLVAFRFMDVRGYTDSGIVSPPHGQEHGLPEILVDAKRGYLDSEVISRRVRELIMGLITGTRRSNNSDQEVHTLLLTEYCRYWHRSLPFMFGAEGGYTDLLIPDNLLSERSVLSRAQQILDKDTCSDVDIIGWLYQFYISERKVEVVANFKVKKAGAEEIPAATQLFTPHWIVRYLVDNSLGRLWLLNRPESSLRSYMCHYIESKNEEADFVRIQSPEELTVMDPACGSGHMLTYAFDLLYQVYEEEGYPPSEIPNLILKNNLYGTEIDPRAAALAAFALTMKAREKQPNFFRHPVAPNICVISPIRFDEAELEFLPEPLGGQDSASTFWNQFEEADILGSLIVPRVAQLEELSTLISASPQKGELHLDSVIDRAHRVLRQLRYLSEKYCVVVANPPYMGSRYMTESLADYAQRYYPSSKADLFSMFIERCLKFAEDGGSVGMITMQAWMFLPSFKDVRRALVNTHRIVSMAHLGSRAFETITGEVVSTTAFILESNGNLSLDGDYFRLTAAKNEQAKAELFRELLESNAGEKDHWRTNQLSFTAVPGAPIAYWADEAVLELFAKQNSVGDVSDVRAGMATGDNDRYVRWWYEVEAHKLKLDAESVDDLWAQPQLKWVIFNKGGDSRRWYGNLDYVIAYDRSTYSLLKNSGNNCPSEEFYFKESITWSDVTSAPFAPRFMPSGSVFSTVGNSIFEEQMPLSELCCALAAPTVSSLLPMINPTLHANPGDVRRLPVPKKGDDTVFEEAVKIARDDWHSVETSWGFGKPDWFRKDIIRVSELFRESDVVWQANVKRLAQLENENERRQRLAFGIEALESSHEVTEDDLRGVTLRRNFYDGGGWNSDTADRIRAVELVSYAVGCMFGRYSIDKPGLIIANQDQGVETFLAEVPDPSFIPNEDNVIPVLDDTWFTTDIVDSFQHFLCASFGERHLAENLSFVEKSLGVKSIRDYFVTASGKSKFYEDHLRLYERRPIYWMFSNTEGTFNALVYLHRYNASTVSTVLRYVREYRLKAEQELAVAEKILVEGRSKKAQKQVDRLSRTLREITDYEKEVLYPFVTQQKEVDLDDGVLVNYLRFGAVLRKDKSIEKKRSDVTKWDWPVYGVES